jgi:hypothetical protein
MLCRPAFFRLPGQWICSYRWQILDALKILGQLTRFSLAKVYGLTAR